MTAILQGVRVLEVAEHTFVPAAAALLADWGADVIKIEHVQRGDAMRGLWTVVQDTLEAAADPQSVANGYIRECRTASGVPFRLVAAPVQFDEQPAQPGRAPEFNEHADQILADLGLDAGAVMDLKVKGVVA